MLKPSVQLEKFISDAGFKWCKKPYEECVYLCVSRGTKMIFVSRVMLDVNDWDDRDPRIHKRANCKYSDKRDVYDIIYQLIKAGMVKAEWEG